MQTKMTRRMANQVDSPSPELVEENVKETFVT